MRHAYLTILLLAALMGCANKTMYDIDQTPPAVNHTKVYTYLALGDSYTIGEAVPAAQAFPNQLAALLTTQGIEVASPTIIARTGWTTGELTAAIKQQAINHRFDFVTLLIGVNNQYRGYSTDDYRTDFVQLLNTAIAYAGDNKKHVFVISIPDWGVTPFAWSRNRQQIAQEIDLYNTINRQESQKAGVNYIDITPGSRSAATDASLIAADGLHPSGKMYGQWAAALAGTVAREFK